MDTAGIENLKMPRHCGKTNEKKKYMPADNPEVYSERVIFVPYSSYLFSPMSSRFADAAETSLWGVSL